MARTRRTTAASGGDIITRYPSLTALFNAIRQAPQYYVGAGNRGHTDFYGRGTRDGMQYILDGASEYEQRETLALMEKINANVAGRERRDYIASPAGSFVNVPDYLQGLPFPMRRRAPVENAQAPVRVVVETLVSGGVDSVQLAKRGAAVAALVMRLSETRPVELYAAWSMMPRASGKRSHRTVVGMVKLDTTPVSISHVVAVMASKEFLRGITFAEAYRQTGISPSGSMAWGWGDSPESAARNKRVREALNLTDADIFIPGGHLSSADQMQRDPVAWVNKFLDSQRDTQ